MIYYFILFSLIKTRLLVSQNGDYKIIPEYDNYHGLLVNDAFMKICNMINDSSVTVRTKVLLLLIINF